MRASARCSWVPICSIAAREQVGAGGPVLVQRGAAVGRQLGDAGVRDGVRTVAQQQRGRGIDHRPRGAGDAGVDVFLVVLPIVRHVLNHPGCAPSIRCVRRHPRRPCVPHEWWSDCPTMNTTSTSSDSTFWQRLGRFCFRRRWVVLGSWLTVLVIVFGTVGAVGSETSSSFSIPDSESKDGFDTLDEYFGGLGSGVTGTIVFKADQGVDDPEVEAALTALFRDVDAIEGVIVTSPYSPEGQQRGLVAAEGESAGLIAYASLDLDETIGEARAQEIGREIEALVESELRNPTGGEPITPAEIDGLQIEVGGQSLGEFEPPESELIGLAFAIVILILAFGSVLAMGLPIGVALFGVSLGAGIITLLTNVMSVPDFAITLGAMIGLGVGIDYALFIVTRYREALRAGESPEERDRHRVGHRRSCRRVRRIHGRDLAARHVHHGPRVHQRARHGRSDHRAGHDDRVGHVAARLPRVRRTADRGHAAARPDRRRPRGRGTARRRARDPAAARSAHPSR